MIDFPGDTKTLIGAVAVDSGQILVCDPCYLRDEWRRDEKPDIPGGCALNRNGRYPFSYEGCCRATGSPNQHGELKFKRGHTGAGVAVRTMYGDGIYPVYAHLGDADRVMSITIDFCPDDE